MKRISTIAIIIFGIQFSLSAQTKICKEDFTPVCDSLAVLISEHTGVEGKLKLDNIMRRKGGYLDFYFNEYLGDFPWRKSDIKWLRTNFKNLFPQEYKQYRLGEIFSRKVNIEKLVTPALSRDGKPSDSRFRSKSSGNKTAIVKPLNSLQPSKGLYGRHIALWQSHGRYYDQGTDRWQWQRPCLFQTCEDMFTQGFVLPYLVPMLENAGAYLLMPRERDTQRNEVIADNDPSCGARGYGQYKEDGRWQDAGYGFADTSATYLDLQNPFKAGTARQALCVGPKSEATSSVTWTPYIPKRGQYAVYISYKTLANSTSAAHYTVNHLGGASEFVVNQKMGGGTWIYLGTFEFDKGQEGNVRLDNRLVEGHSYDVGSIVTADAVRFGGGMGNIARSSIPSVEDSLNMYFPEPAVSGLPRYAEGARYYLQWAGADSTVYYQNEGKSDYRDDFMSRGDWVEWISLGSKTNPKVIGGLGIPVDLSFGFHTDAGVTPNDSIVGTLAIYTYKSDGNTKLPAGENRMTSRMYADMVQSQIVEDIRAEFDSLWTRRSIWDRGYRESRTPSCPAMLLELLSHQNFADMRYGLDPSFRFTVSRAIYKGMLKYLSSRYGCNYAVQPLPVDHMASEFEGGNKISVSWKPVHDHLEPTAVPSGYIVYRRIGNGAWDKGTMVTDLDADSHGHIRFLTDIPAGEVVSFKVAAYNDGGMSFPSETVSIGIPHNGQTDSTILIVNNFDRTSGPAWFDGEERAGFDSRSDNGVGQIRDITHIGDMHNFNRSEEWISNDRPGFGASYSDLAGEIIAGNTFDYASVHGRAILEAGYPFHSCSNERFMNDQHIHVNDWTLDIICGKQIKTPYRNSIRYSVFPEKLQMAVRKYASDGGNILVSGAYIGTDLADSIYPIQKDSTGCALAKKFAEDVLGYRFITNQAGRKGKVIPANNRFRINTSPVDIAIDTDSETYCIESPDGIAPASSGQTIYRYADSGISAGVASENNGYRCIALGFPIEALCGQEMIDSLIETTLEFFKK